MADEDPRGSPGRPFRLALRRPSPFPRNSVEIGLGVLPGFSHSNDRGRGLSYESSDSEEKTMSPNNQGGQSHHPTPDKKTAPCSDGSGESWTRPPDEGTFPRLRVRTIERTALVRFVDAESLFEAGAVEAVGQRLHQLLAEESHTRLVIDFGAVSFISSDVLAVLASLQRQVASAHGSITLCGLNRSLREILRVTHLDGVFDVCNDEAEALGLLVR